MQFRAAVAPLGVEVLALEPGKTTEIDLRIA